MEYKKGQSPSQRPNYKRIDLKGRVHTDYYTLEEALDKYRDLLEEKKAIESLIKMLTDFNDDA